MQAFFIGTNSKYIHTALGIRYVAEYCREQGFLSVHRLEVTVNEPVLSVLTRITEQIEQAAACLKGCQADNRSLIRALKKQKQTEVTGDLILWLTQEPVL